MNKAIIITSISALYTVGCFQHREYNRYQDLSLQQGDTQCKIRLIGSYKPEGKVAVGNPYELFVSFHPPIEDLTELDIELVSIRDEKKIEFKSVEVESNQATEKEVDFKYISIKNLNLEYVDYSITIKGLKGLDVDLSDLHLKLKKTEKIENSWWSKASSI